MLMLSWPPATTMVDSPLRICWAARATWRAGFWPSPAERIWPRMASSMSSGERPARSMAARTATVPRTWAWVVAKAPLKLPTGVRPAETMTTSSIFIPPGPRRVPGARLAGARFGLRRGRLGGYRGFGQGWPMRRVAWLTGRGRMDELIGRNDASGLAVLVARGEVSAAELLEAAIAR